MKSSSYSGAARPRKRTGADHFGLFTLFLLLAASLALYIRLMATGMLSNLYLIILMMVLIVLNAVSVIVQLPLRRNKAGKLIMGIVSLLLSGAMLYGVVAVNSVQSALSKIVGKMTETEITEVRVMNDNPATSMGDTKGYTFGYIADAEKLTGTAISAADKKLVQDKMTALQNEFNETFAKVELKNATETSRQMAAKAHATALAMIDYLTEGSFNDVAAGSWYADAVKNVVNKGLMAGTGKDTFAPDNQVTRAMMWTVLARLDGKDVSGASTWYAKAMTWATEKGVSDGTFPGNSITREQLATMLWRAAGSPEAKGALTNFNDAASVSSWATQAMTWAVEQGLISGMGDGALNPQGNATRAQLAVILTAYAK